MGRIVGALLGIALVGCGGARTPPVVAAPAPDSAAAAPAAPLMPRSDLPRAWDALDTGAVRIPILVATTRRAVNSERPGDRFGSSDADQLGFGLAHVSVPSYRARAEGSLPRTSGTGDPAREMFVATLLPADSTRFVQRLGEDLARTRSRDVLVFVHGYNTTFEEASVRLAQLVADMGWDGTAVLFTWPSAGGLTGYIRDQQTARNAGWHLRRLLQDLLPRANPDRVHVIAHSMGSEVLSRAVALLDRTQPVPRLAQVIFASPDVDARIFAREILPPLRERAEGITLYSSTDDDALRLSRALNGVWRLGLGGDSLTVLDGMTTVDASRVRGDLLGHTLFGSSALLSDLHALLTDARAPAERRLLQVRRADGTTFWRFR